MRVVIDVNVWVSGLLWGGLPGQILSLARNKRITSYISAELLLELKTTLQRDKFRQRLQERNYSVDSLLAIVQAISEIVQISEIAIPALRDPADAKIMATAITAHAECLITGDQDLLILQEFQGFSILTPTQMLDNYFPS
uniref:Nucleotide binding protein PINc n=1 Tax=Cyanothece sp. (strain PCC 7425 / ATCC 29141) TaxID=395961 RepID=B8HMW1_CYAP4